MTPGKHSPAARTGHNPQGEATVQQRDVTSGPLRVCAKSCLVVSCSDFMIGHMLAFTRHISCSGGFGEAWVFWLALLPFLFFFGRMTLIAAASSEVLMCVA